MKRTGLLLTVLSLACLLRGSAQDRMDPREGDQFTVDYMEGEDKKRDPKRLKGDETRSQVKATHYHLKNLKDPDPSIRENSCEMLGIVGSKEGIPYLIEALQDRHIMVQIKAQGALSKITGKNFGYKNYAAWRSWWETEGKDFNARPESGPSDTKKFQAANFNTQGLELLKAGHFSPAATMFLNAVNLDTQNATYKNNLGMSVMKQGRVLDAMSYFDEVMGLDGTLPEPYMNIGQCYARINRDIEAQHWFKQAIERDKDGRLWETFWLLGKQYLNNGDYNLALEFLDQARSKAERNRRFEPHIYRDLALTHYGLDQYHSAWREIKNVERLGYALNEDFITKVRKYLVAEGIDPDKEDTKAIEVSRGMQP